MYGNKIQLCILFLLSNLAYGQSKLIYNTVNIEKNRIQFADYFDSVSPVILETNPACVLSRIQKVVSNNHRIGIISNRKVYIFSKRGEFITVLPSGRGPEDIIYPFDIDVYNEEFYILTGDGKVKVFNMNGIFIDSYKLPMISEFFSVLNENNVLLYHYREKQSPYYISFYNVKDHYIYKDYLPENRFGKNAFRNEYPFSKCSEGISFLHLFSDTLYIVDKYSQIECLPLDFGEMQLSPNYYDQFDKEYSMAKNNNIQNRIHHHSGFFRTDSLILFRPRINYDKSGLFIYNLKTQKSETGFPATFFFGDIYQGELIGLIKGTTNDEFIFAIQATQLKRTFDKFINNENLQEYEILMLKYPFLQIDYDRISIESNPVLFFAKPK